MSKHNYFWLGILILSLIGTLILFRIAYANPSDLPSYAFVNSQVKEAYEFVKLSPEKLEGLPCNCGCMSADGASAHGGRVHSRGLVDCFTQGDINNGGKWDSHASECGLCYEDALLAKSLYNQGKTKEEIKKSLEEKYKTQTFSNNTIY